MVLKQLG